MSAPARLTISPSDYTTFARSFNTHVSPYIKTRDVTRISEHLRRGMVDRSICTTLIEQYLELEAYLVEAIVNTTRIKDTGLTIAHRISAYKQDKIDPMVDVLIDSLESRLSVLQQQLSLLRVVVEPNNTLDGYLRKLREPYDLIELSPAPLQIEPKRLSVRPTVAELGYTRLPRMRPKIRTSGGSLEAKRPTPEELGYARIPRKQPSRIIARPPPIDDIRYSIRTTYPSMDSPIHPYLRTRPANIEKGVGGVRMEMAQERSLYDAPLFPASKGRLPEHSTDNAPLVPPVKPRMRRSRTPDWRGNKEDTDPGMAIILQMQRDQNPTSPPSPSSAPRDNVKRYPRNRRNHDEW